MHKKIKKAQLGLNTSSLISNNALQQPTTNYYSWMSPTQKYSALNQQYTFNNPFTTNKNLGDWETYLNSIKNNQQQNPIDYLNFIGGLSGGVSNALGQVTNAIGSNSSSPIT